MSYRIHLNIINKKYYNKYLKEFRKDNDEDKYFDPKTIIHTEISDSLNLEKFKIIKGIDEEYPSFILKQKDIKIILDHYQNEQIEILKERIDRNKKIKDLYSEKKGFKKAEDEIFLLLQRDFHLNYYVHFYFEGLKKDNECLKDSDYFLLQYFYLTKLYFEYDKKNVYIITHG